MKANAASPVSGPDVSGPDVSGPDVSGPAAPTVLVIIPYFGSWPVWIDFFIESCKWNPSMDWLLVGDCGETDNRAPNVRHVEMPFAQFRRLVNTKLGAPVALERPYKICDLKLALGHIFEEYAEAYDFFGFSDVDVVFGNIRKILAQDVFDNDFIAFNNTNLTGHFCLLRNSPPVRGFYRSIEGWDEAIRTPGIRATDERRISSIDDRLRVYARESFNTPLERGIPWRDGSLVFPQEWTWRAGTLTNDLDGDVEFLYLHFMHWKGGPWARECGNAHWEKLDRIVHVDYRDAAEGFRVNERGFLPPCAERS